MGAHSSVFVHEIPSEQSIFIGQYLEAEQPKVFTPSPLGEGRGEGAIVTIPLIPAFCEASHRPRGEGE